MPLCVFGGGGFPLKYFFSLSISIFFIFIYSIKLKIIFCIFRMLTTSNKSKVFSLSQTLNFLIPLSMAIIMHVEPLVIKFNYCEHGMLVTSSMCFPCLIIKKYINLVHITHFLKTLKTSAHAHLENSNFENLFEFFLTVRSIFKE